MNSCNYKVKVRKLREKTLPTLLLLALILIGGLTRFYQVHVPEVKAASTTLKVDSVYNVTSPGMTFKVNITVTDVTNLQMYIIDLKWNASIIKVSTGDHNGIGIIDPIIVDWVYFNIYEGPFIENARPGQNAIFMANEIDNVAGKIKHLSGGWQTFGPSSSGSGLLATINFTSVQVGETPLNVTYSALKNNQTQIIDHTYVNGLVTSKPPPVYPIWTELWFQEIIAGIMIIAIIAIVAIAIIRRRKKFPKAPPKREEEAEELLSNDLRYQKSRI